MNLRLSLLVFGFIFISCDTKKSKEIIQEFDQEGNLIAEYEVVYGLKEGLSTYYYNDENSKYSKSEFHWKNDSATFQINFDQQNHILSQGPLKGYNFKIGKWKYYDNNQNLKEIKELIDLNDSTYLNQNWKLNKKGDTIGGNYYSVVFKDTVKLNSYNRFYFLMERPLFSRNSKVDAYLVRENAFKEQYYENDSLRYDRIENLSSRFRNKNVYQDKNHHIIFDAEASKLGKIVIAGYLMEVEIKPSEGYEEYDSITKNTYFRHEFNVVE
ncbi:hypothetical protein [Mesohalobacter halotolerans]|uniref:Uncharacterized protein n=1 Tax=Mesohalobacter halotolerans TaxID=1883405 RepID=A0A4U5TUK9_9FLAO|nr:hypothetical protein [Mesohalobacter halotolerans]TKS57204.1 hypothetical protein FCN74_01945 [Mesohalobacter halotolerans]